MVLDLKQPSYTLVAIVQLLSRVFDWFEPRDCRRPGFPVLHYLLESAQTHVH